MAQCVFYQPADRGVHDPGGDKAITYYGTTYRVPASAYNTIQQMEWERTPREIIHPIELPDGTILQPDPAGIIERTDTLDADTGDLLVTYRVPYHRGLA